MLLATAPALEQRRATRRKERGTFHRKQEALQTEGITQRRGAGICDACNWQG